MRWLFFQGFAAVGLALWDELGIEDAVDEALLELSEQVVGPEQVAGLAVILEKLVEDGVGDRWFHSDVLVLVTGHISGKHLHKKSDTTA